MRRSSPSPTLSFSGASGPDDLTRFVPRSESGEGFGADRLLAHGVQLCRGGRASRVGPGAPSALSGGLERAGVSGVVQVEYVVGSDGRVDPQSVRVLASTHPAFLLAALEALRDARFKPARRGGRSIAVLVQQTIRFRQQ